MRATLSILAVLTLSLCTLAVAQTSVRDLPLPATITGCLGKPLGTCMTISGRRANAKLPNPIGVSEVDGKDLKQVVEIEIRGGLQIQKDVHYLLEGYEAGEFSGPPSCLSSNRAAVFCYRSFFVVTKVIEPKPE